MPPKATKKTKTRQTRKNEQLSKSDDEGEKIFSCAVCNVEVEETDKALACDCNTDKWHHIECIGISEQQYEKICQDENFKMTWVCNICKTLKPTQANDTNNPQQYEEIVKILLEDISVLKEENDSLKKENDRLSEVIAKKTQVTYKLENLIYSLTKPNELNLTAINNDELNNTKRDSDLYSTKCRSNHETKADSTKANECPKIKQAEKPISNNKTRITKHETNDGLVKTNTIGRPDQTGPSTKPPINQNDYPKCPLLIGDSLLKTSAKLINEKIDASIKIIPGGRIQDASRFLASQMTMPDKVLINMGTNNLPSSQTPNHVMRPLWLTLEQNIKRFPKTKWYVNSIPIRENISKTFLGETNKALKFMCTELKINFIDNSNVLNKTHLSWDGLHLNRDGAKLLADCIVNTLECQEIDRSYTTEEEAKELRYRTGTNATYANERQLNKEKQDEGEEAENRDQEIQELIEGPCRPNPHPNSKKASPPPPT